jgi:hypothetical protein
LIPGDSFRSVILSELEQARAASSSGTPEVSITIAFRRRAFTLSATADQTSLILVDCSTTSGPVSPKHNKASPPLSIRKAADSMPAWLSGYAVTFIAVSLSAVGTPDLRS